MLPQADPASTFYVLQPLQADDGEQVDASEFACTKGLQEGRPVLANIRAPLRELRRRFSGRRSDKSGKARDLGAPSLADREAYETTHLPFRSRCPERVTGRRDNPSHQKVAAEARDLPEVGMDYCYLRRAECEDEITVLLQKDRNDNVNDNDTQRSPTSVDGGLALQA